jgi:iduronate 2-sulfatase
MTANKLLRLQLLAFVALVSAAAGSGKPNVLLLCVDDLKPILGCYGDNKALTPHIDKLASRSMLFENAYCNQAVCAPSRHALMTGLRPDTIGIYDLATNFRTAMPNAVTLSQAFMKAGYKAMALGKIYHVGHGNGDDRASWSIPHWSAKGSQYALAENTKPQRKNKTSDRGPATESADVPDDAYADGKAALEAVQRLKQLKANPTKPFFLAVGFSKPHLPFVAPKKYWDLYPRSQIQLAAFRKAPEGAPSYSLQDSGELRQYFGIPATGPFPDDLQRELIHGYYAATSYADAQIGRVLRALDETGLAQNTIVVLWADHGWHLGDHGIWCKHTNYEQANRIPFLISAPGTKAGQRTKAFAETVDLYPTLCELAGVPMPLKTDGQSLVKILRDPAASNKDHAFHVYPRRNMIGRAIRTARYRLVEWKVPGAAPDSATLELYDYQNDPLEKKNIAAEDPATVAKMRNILAQYPEAKPQVVNIRKP